MADSELDAIRAKRLAELQQQPGQQRPMGAGEGERNSTEEQRQKQEDMRNTMLSSLLTQEARARLNTIILTKPEKGRMVEDILLQNARRGAFGSGKVSSSLKFKKQII
jgi:programmed cell death protein 5